MIIDTLVLDAGVLQHDTVDNFVPICRRNREAAVRRIEADQFAVPSNIRAGHMDGDRIVKAFAQHRVDCASHAGLSPADNGAAGAPCYTVRMDDREFAVARQEMAAQFTKPAAVGAVIFGYFAAPVLRYIDPFWLYPLGVMLATGVTVTTWGVTVSRPEHMVKVSIAGIILTAIAMAGLAYQGIPAQRVALHLDRQCQIIEQDMMRVQPARADSHDLYAALGCRPQATSTLRLPANKGWVQDERGVFLAKP